MKLDSVKNKGVKVYQGARISNGIEILSETLETSVMYETAGVHSLN